MDVPTFHGYCSGGGGGGVNPMYNAFTFDCQIPQKPSHPLLALGPLLAVDLEDKRRSGILGGRQGEGEGSGGVNGPVRSCDLGLAWTQ